MTVVRTALLWLIAVAPAFAQGSLVTVTTAKAVEICGDCKERHPKFGVSVASAPVQALMAKQPPAAIEVLVDGRQNPSLIKHFTFAWQGGQKNVPRELVLTIAEALREPGVYSVLVDLLPVN